MINSEKDQVSLNQNNLGKLAKLVTKMHKEFQSNMQYHDKFVNEIESTLDQKLQFNHRINKSIL